MSLDMSCVAARVCTPVDYCSLQWLRYLYFVLFSSFWKSNERGKRENAKQSHKKIFSTNYVIGVSVIVKALPKPFFSIISCEARVLERRWRDSLLPIGSFHILEAIEKFWFNGSTVRPIVHHMISSLANYRPFFSSFPHIPPSGELCQVN